MEENNKKKRKLNIYNVKDKVITDSQYKAAIYIRTSADPGKDSEKRLTNQLDSVRMYCEKKKIQVVKIYNEGVRSAAYPLNNPVLKQLIEKDICNKKFNCIVVFDEDWWKIVILYITPKKPI